MEVVLSHQEGAAETAWTTRIRTPPITDLGFVHDVWVVLLVVSASRSSAQIPDSTTKSTTDSNPHDPP